MELNVFIPFSHFGALMQANCPRTLAALLFLRESLIVSFNLTLPTRITRLSGVLLLHQTSTTPQLPPTPRILRYFTYSHVIRMFLFENITNIWLELAFDSRPTNTCTSTCASTTIRLQKVTWSSEVPKYHFVKCLSKTVALYYLSPACRATAFCESGGSFVKEIQPTKSLKEFLQQIRKEIPRSYAHSALRQRGFSLGGQVRGAGRNWGILKRSTFSTEPLH